MIAESIDPVARPAEWLEARRAGIGASEAAAACGLSPHETPLALYLKKIGELPDEPPSIPMRAGLALEPLIAELYREATGARLVGRQVFLRADQFDDPPLFATLDAVRDDGVPVELKSVERAPDELGEPGTDELPAHWLCQCHQQLIVTGAERVELAILVGKREFRGPYVVRPDDRVAFGLLQRLSLFWRSVRERIPPPPLDHRDARLVAGLFRPTGEEVALDFTAAEFAAEWERLGPQLRDLAERRDMLKAQLIHRLGGAIGVLPDGRRLRHDLRDVPERTQHVKAHQISTLRIVKGRE